MIRDQDRYHTFSRRAVLLAAGKLTLFSGLAARMYYLQVIEADRYKMLAEDNRINMRLLAPPRGIISDRYGVEIATNQQNYQLIIVPERSPDIDKTLARIAGVIALDDRDRKRVRREIRRNRSFVPVTVRDNLDWREVAKIEVNTPDLPGILIEVGQTRRYPFGETAAHLLGYVGVVSERELTGDPLLKLPSFRVGKSGIDTPIPNVTMKFPVPVFACHSTAALGPGPCVTISRSPSPSMSTACADSDGSPGPTSLLALNTVPRPSRFSYQPAVNEIGVVNLETRMSRSPSPLRSAPVTEVEPKARSSRNVWLKARSVW